MLDFMADDVKFDEEAMTKETEEIESYSDSFIIPLKKKLMIFQMQTNCQIQVL